MSKAAKHMKNIGTNDFWETPPDVYEKFCKKIGIYPELDVCATKTTTKCKQYFGPDHSNSNYRNGLHQLWNKPFFMNPPYTQKEIWIEYAIKQSIAWGVPSITLVFAKTDTQWWNNLITKNDFIKVYFHVGRIRFWRNGKPGPAPAPYGNAWLVINP